MWRIGWLEAGSKLCQAGGRATAATCRGCSGLLDRLRSVPMQYPRLYADRDGVSHFEDVEVDLPLTEYLPGELLLRLAQPRAATTIVFAHLPAGWQAGRHPSPKAPFHHHAGGGAGG